MKYKRYLSVLLTLVTLFALAACEARETAPDDRSEDTTPSGFTPIDQPEEEETGEPEPADLSFEAITEGIELPATKEFLITRPEQELETVQENYYITGVSDPAESLSMNGIPVEDRGILGSFGVYVPLEIGENSFRFEHGGAEEILVITRLEYEDYAVTDAVTSPQPAYDTAVRGGEPITLSCIAPAGALVTATVGEETVEMTQSVDTAREGVPVRFTAAFDPGETGGAVELGSVAYIMSRGEDTKSTSSVGSLFAVGAEDTLLVRVEETAVVAFNEESDASGFHGTLKRGAVDRVDVISYNTGDEMYRLASGGWVFKRSVQPYLADVPYESEVRGVTSEEEDGFEIITFHGTATPPYSAEIADGILSLTFYHTTLATELALSGSELFTEAASSQAGDGTTIDFSLDMDNYWGHLVQYDGVNTVLTLKRRPEITASEERPLEGISVLLDPGHGGTDNGAAGVALTEGAMEKDINLAAATATRRYLEGLGAIVTMTRAGDEKTELDEILAENESGRPDFFLSLHSNSLSYASDGTEPSGVEVFYYEDSDEALASALVNGVTERTGRVNREAKQDYYRVTLCSLSRSILIEMGFLTNPVEYDALRSLDEIYNTAAAIGDSLAAYLSPEEEETVSE